MLSFRAQVYNNVRSLTVQTGQNARYVLSPYRVLQMGVHTPPVIWQNSYFFSVKIRADGITNPPPPRFLGFFFFNS